MRAHFSDMDLLYAHGTGLEFITAGDSGKLSGAELIILPCSRRVEDDLNYLPASGLAGGIRKAAERDAFILWIC